MGQMPTVEDVARVANVSRQTVSNVLNSPHIVKALTRDRVLAAIQQLGYRPHASARRLRTQKSSTIGVRLEALGNGISGSVLDTFLHALTEQADVRHMRILLFTANNAQDEIDQIRRLRDGADVDGFVLTSTTYADPRVKWLVENDVPFATFGRPWGADNTGDPRHRWVDVDGRTGVREATAHLINSGMKRVGYIGWSAPSGAGDDRRQGWKEALTTAGLDGTGLDVAVEDTVVGASRSTETLLTMASPAEALICASDTLALGATFTANALGLKEIPIIGFDNTPVAAAVGLSSIKQPLDEVATGILDLLLGASGSAVVGNTSISEEPTNRLLVPQLVERRHSQLQLGETSGH
ncbi:LacI family DNA-binding transcriptional regulator [Rhodoglobus sp.]